MITRSQSSMSRLQLLIATSTFPHCNSHTTWTLLEHTLQHVFDLAIASRLTNVVFIRHVQQIFDLSNRPHCRCTPHLNFPTCLLCSIFGSTERSLQKHTICVPLSGPFMTTCCYIIVAQVVSGKRQIGMHDTTMTAATTTNDQI